MKPSFLIFHAENANDSQNAICHLILIPVVDGISQPALEFFFNPEAPFYYVMSGITPAQVESFSTYAEQWPDVQKIFDSFDLAICTASGYSAHALYNTLTRLGINFSPVKYCNAKAICRRTLDEVSYSIDYLSYKFYNDYIPLEEPVKIAQRWCDLVLKGLADKPEQSFDDLLAHMKIQSGEIAPDNFVPALSKRDYSQRVVKAFDASSVNVEAQPEHPFFGMNVVFTGKMESMKRDDARAAVVRIGGLAPERLTQDTNYLVVGVQDLRVVGEKGLSGKMKTAAKYKEKGMPIEIIDEQDFLDMLGEKNIPAQKSQPVRTFPFLSEDDLGNVSDEDLKKLNDALSEFRKKIGRE